MTVGAVIDLDLGAPAALPAWLPTIRVRGDEVLGDGGLGAWEVDLSQLAGSRPAGEFVLASDRVGFFRAYYADEIGVSAET